MLGSVLRAHFSGGSHNPLQAGGKESSVHPSLSRPNPLIVPLAQPSAPECSPGHEKPFPEGAQGPEPLLSGKRVCTTFPTRQPGLRSPVNREQAAAADARLDGCPLHNLLVRVPAKGTGML